MVEAKCPECKEWFEVRWRDTESFVGGWRWKNACRKPVELANGSIVDSFCVGCPGCSRWVDIQEECEMRDGKN